MKLVTVYQTFNPMDAQLIRSRLEAAGLQASVAHELSSLSLEGYALAAGGVLVQVAEGQEETARELILAKEPTPE